MATRSTISALFTDGIIRQVYCHWDGDLEGVGETLRTEYTNQDKIEAFIMAGDHSSIVQGKYTNPETYVQRGEEYNPPRILENPNDVEGEEFNYHWNGKNWIELDHPEWNDPTFESEPQTLAEALIQIEKLKAAIERLKSE